MDVATHRSLCVGICSHSSHPTPIHTIGHVVANKTKVKVDGDNVAVHTDLVVSNCNHTGNLICTSKVKELGLSVGKVTDQFVGDFSGYVVQGNPKVQIP